MLKFNQNRQRKRKLKEKEADQEVQDHQDQDHTAKVEVDLTKEEGVVIKNIKKTIKIEDRNIERDILLRLHQGHLLVIKEKGENHHLHLPHHPNR
jgi:hypothetical protein